MLSGKSLWGDWIKHNLLRKRSFWEVNGKTQAGSWMWRKMLKVRDVAKSFYMKAVGNGRHISFWYHRWSDLGVLMDVLSERGLIDLGIRRDATVEDVLQTSRRRMRHRSSLLKDIERALDSFRDQLNTAEDDVDMWRRLSGYKLKFSTHETWLLLREAKPQCPWSKGIWFSQATPKFAFMAWLATRGRLSTMDRISQWSQGIDTTCVLCKNTPESRNHLFFECSFSTQVWEHLVKCIL